MNIKDIAREIHKNAKEHGWWDGKREFGELIALCHSELSEALEEYRAGNPPCKIYYRYDKKPEGIPMELADVIIRILDMCEHYEFGYDKNIKLFREDSKKTGTLLKRRQEMEKTFGEHINECHKRLTYWHDVYIDCVKLADVGVPADIAKTELKLADLLNYIFDVCEYYGINIEDAIKEKHEYNKTRPYRHGGKML